jgi:hypothetical protein
MEKSLLANGKLARYYELQTNRPLYMTEDYELTHDRSRVPKHYGWETESPLAEIDAAMASLRGSNGSQAAPEPPTAEAVRGVVESLDAEGKWLSRHEGEMLVGQPKFQVGEAYVSSAVFAANVELLARFIKPDLTL